MPYLEVYMPKDHKWTLEISRALYVELKHFSLDEGMSINELCKPAIDAFNNELLKIRENIISARKKQLEEAALAQVPLVVSGHQVNPLEYAPAF